MSETRRMVVWLFSSIIVLVMAGSAMAESIVVSPAVQQIAPNGGIATYTINVSQINSNGATHTISATTTYADTDAGASYDDLRFRFTFGSTSSAWLSNGSSWTWDDDGSDSATLTLEVQDVGTVVGVTYQFTVEDSYSGFTPVNDTASATAYSTSIPEFTTIAVPVAIALLAGLFFFRRQ